MVVKCSTLDILFTPLKTYITLSVDAIHLVYKYLEYDVYEFNENISSIFICHLC